MKERHYKNRKRLRMIPIIVGIYGVFLGFGLTVMGLVQIREGIGIVRFLTGLGLVGFGLLGVWDGVRDVVRPEKKPDKPIVSQFILTDISGNRSSNVTMERLREQLTGIAESSDGTGFHIQILPPLPVKEQGKLKQVSCLYQSLQENPMTLTAFWENADGSYQINQKNAAPDEAEEWLRKFLAGNPEFTGWECARAIVKEDKQPDEAAAYWHELFINQNGLMTYWHRLLVIFGESWHDELKFFSARDVELAVEGIHEGKYQKAVLEWGIQTFHLLPGAQSDVMVIWCTNNSGKGNTRFLAREGTVIQVKFWLAKYLDRGFFEEMSGWSDITAQAEEENRKGKKNHGKVF